MPMRGLVLSFLVLAVAHLAQAVHSFISARADLGTLFDVATAAGLAASALCLSGGRQALATSFLVPMVLLELLEIAHAAAPLRAHGPSRVHAMDMAVALALGGYLLFVRQRLRADTR